MSKPTLSEIAQRLGVSRPRVSQLVRLGMPTHAEAAALAWYQANIRPQFGRSLADNPAAAEFAQARATRQLFAAKMAELDYLERTGRLVRVERYRALLGPMFASLRDALDAIPGRLGAQLAAEPDSARCAQLLRRQFEEAMDAAVEQFNGLKF